MSGIGLDTAKKRLRNWLASALKIEPTAKTAPEPPPLSRPGQSMPKSGAPSRNVVMLQHPAAEEEDPTHWDPYWDQGVVDMEEY